MFGIRFNFINWVIPIRNSLSNQVVFANSIYTFKNRLDNFGLIKKCCMITKQIFMASGTVVL